MVEVFSDDLQTGLSHFISGEVDPRDSFDRQQPLHLFSAFLPQAVFAEVDHLQTPHIDDSAEKFPQ